MKCFKWYRHLLFVEPTFSLARIICLHPVLIIAMSYITQVFLAALWPPLQLFGPNRLRDDLAFRIFAPLGSPTNHLLAGQLTYFKQHIAYASFLWYFLLLKLRLRDLGKPEDELRRRENWGSVHVRTVLIALVVVIWACRYFVENGGEEAFWGPVGKGMISGFCKLTGNPVDNARYAFVVFYRIVETGTYLLCWMVAAVTLPMFFNIGTTKRTDNKPDIYATTGQLIHRSIALLPIMLIFFLIHVSNTTGIGELSPRPYIWLTFIVLFSIVIYTVRDLWYSVGSPSLPSEQRLGRMVICFILPTVSVLGFLALKVQGLDQLGADPEHVSKTLESRVINDFGEIFEWKLDKREKFRERLKELVEREFTENRVDDRNCNPINFESAKALTLVGKRFARLSCLQTQVAIQYGLEQLPMLLCDPGMLSDLRSDMCKDGDSRDKVARKIDQVNDEKLSFFGKATLLAIRDLAGIDKITMDCEGVRVYTAIRRELRSEFDQYIGGVSPMCASASRS